MRIRLAQHAVRELVVGLRPGEQVRQRYLDVVEVQFALVHRAESDLVEWLAARDAGQVERHDHGHAGTGASLLIDMMTEQRAHLRRHRA